MIKVGIIQTQDYSNNSQGISKVAKEIEKLGKKETDIICLPEQWLKNNQIKNFKEEFRLFLKLSRDYRLTVIPGAFYEKRNKSAIITTRIIGPEGEVIGKQNKIHPFDYEKKIISPGSRYEIFKTSCKFGVLICYDMVFPEVAKTLTKKGADILFSPSRIVKKRHNSMAYVCARKIIGKQNSNNSS